MMHLQNDRIYFRTIPVAFKSSLASCNLRKLRGLNSRDIKEIIQNSHDFSCHSMKINYERQLN